MDTGIESMLNPVISEPPVDIPLYDARIDENKLIYERKV
jgi:hypothetical protein